MIWLNSSSGSKVGFTLLTEDVILHIGTITINIKELDFKLILR